MDWFRVQFRLFSHHCDANLSVTHLLVTFPDFSLFYCVFVPLLFMLLDFHFCPPLSEVNCPTKYFLSLSVTPPTSLMIALETGNYYFFFSVSLAMSREKCRVKQLSR